jgi:hypothetical protein
MGKENVYTSCDFNYPHSSLTKTIEAITIFKYSNGRILLVEKEVFMLVWEEHPVSIIPHDLRHQFEVNCILHDYPAEKKGLENIMIRTPQKLLINNAGTVLRYESMLEMFEDCKGIQINDPFEGEERFIPVGLGGYKERGIMWEIWKKLYDLEGSVRLEKPFNPSLFLNGCKLGESIAFAGS